MIETCMEDFRNQRVLIAGLGTFGGQVAAAKWLVGQGADVLVTDRAPAANLAQSLKALEGLPLKYRLGEHRIEDFTSADLIVASPAIPPHSEFLQAARAANVPVTTEIKLFIERCPAAILGVTGSKGKSTATTMLGEILKRRFTTWVGGNIGGSLLPELPRIEKSHLVVLELSSFMLEYLGQIRWSPHVALVTMITAAHLDWHGSEEAYVEAKKNVVRHQRAEDYAILPEDDPAVQSFAHVTPAKVIEFGIKRRKRFELDIPGEHNQGNAQAAFAAAQVMGASREDAQAALRHLQGLPHRLQLVHEEHGVKFYNDSIATIPEAAIAALHSFPDKRVIQIVGGHDHHLPTAGLCAALAARAKAVLCIGQTAAQISTGIAPISAAPAVHHCDHLVAAVKLAKEIAALGDIVLLSPGFPSYGQFTNFEQRGETFIKEVRKDATPSPGTPGEGRGEGRAPIRYNHAT